MIIASTDGQVMVGDEWISHEETQIGDCKVSVGSRNCEERETIAVTIKLEEPATLFLRGLKSFVRLPFKKRPTGKSHWSCIAPCLRRKNCCRSCKK